jgi:DNA primase
MAGKIPQNFIDELLSRADIVEVINCRVPLKKAGREYQACCPFHNEKTPSFTVSPNKQFYHCFGCGAHGTAIGFLMEYERLSFPEAIEELAAQQGLEIPREVSFDQGPDHRPVYDILDKVSNYYRQQLRQHAQAQQAINYLKQRGLSGEIAAEYALGYAPPGWDNLIKQFGSTEQGLRQLRHAGLINEKDGKRYDRLRERIIFPIRDGRGRVIGFGGRLLGDGKPKYLNSPETAVFHKSQALYGLYEARQTRQQLQQMLVVEGYMDVVALAQFAIRNVVATLGTATTADHLQKLYRACNEVVFCFDGDRAGRDAAWKALQTTLPLLKDGRQARFLFLPEGEDPDSLVRKIGAQAFSDQLNNAQPLSEFLFAKLEAQVDTQSIDGLARLAELAKPLISQLPSSTFRSMLEQKLEQKMGLKVELQQNTNNQTIRRKPIRPNSQQPGTMPPIRKAVALVLQYPNAVQQNLPEGWRELDQPGIDTLADLVDATAQQPNMNSAALVERHPDPKIRQFLAQLAITELAVQNDAAEQLHSILVNLLEKARKQQRERLLKASPSSLSEEEKRHLRELYQNK